MSFNDLARRRYSCREFAQISVEVEKIHTILEAAQLAPTAKNAQAQRIYILTEPEHLDMIDEYSTARYNAPVVAVICSDQDLVFQSTFVGTFSDIDTGIIIAHMALAATDVGLSTYITGAVEMDRLHDAMGLPHHIKVREIMGIGYPEDSIMGEPSFRHSDRRPLSETVTFGIESEDL